VEVDVGDGGSGEPAVAKHLGPGPAVEVGDIVSAHRDHDGVGEAGAGGVPPVVGEPLADGLSGVGGGAVPNSRTEPCVAHCEEFADPVVVPGPNLRSLFTNTEEVDDAVVEQVDDGSQFCPSCHRVFLATMWSCVDDGAARIELPPSSGSGHSCGPRGVEPWLAKPCATSLGQESRGEQVNGVSRPRTGAGGGSLLGSSSG
jgi:hypothetical protein